MTDETDNGKKGEKPETETAQGPVAGERLAAARREQQISLEDVAKELHLDEPTVRALERNEFGELGAPVFAKGHLRKYAELVGISMDETVAEYDALNRAGDEPPLVVERRKLPREISLGPWIALLLVLVAGASAYWWFVLRVPAAPEAPASAPVAGIVAMPESGGDTAADAAAPGTRPRDVGEPSTVVPEAAEETTVAETAPDPEPPAAGQAVLTLNYGSDCWTEVTDADGQRLFFALGREGRSVDLVGRAPFAVVFGDAEAVDIEVDGVPFDIPASARTGRMARLSIDAR